MAQEMQFHRPDSSKIGKCGTIFIWGSYKNLFVYRASYSQLVFPGYVGINPGGLNVGVSKKILDRANVIPVFEKMRCKTVAK